MLPALFAAAVAAAQLAHRSGSARAPLAAAVVFSVLLAVPLVWRRRYPAATFGLLAAIALIQWVTGTRLMADVALLIALYAMFEHSPARINWLAAGAGTRRGARRPAMGAVRLPAADALAADRDRGSRDRSSSAMAQVSVTGREALQDMRGLLGVLRTENDGTALRPQPGLADLGTLFQQLRATGLDVQPEVTFSSTPVTRPALMYGPGQTVIEVEDDGDGLPSGSDQHAGDRHGLTGMAERVAAYGGRLHAGPGPGRGWCLRATVPTPRTPAPGEQQ